MGGRDYVELSGKCAGRFQELHGAANAQLRGNIGHLVAWILKIGDHHKGSPHLHVIAVF